MATPQFSDGALITTRQLAELLGIGVRTVEHYRANYPEKLPPHIVILDRTIRYRYSTVQSWLAQHEEIRSNL